MTADQISLLLIIAATMIGFVWGRWRYDVVAGLALLTSVYAGVVSADAAFVGFGHPAVVTVAAVLVIGRALQNAGIVGWLVRILAPSRRTTTMQVAAGSGLTMLLSAMMNNVGALALMLPVTLRNASRAKRPASILLIPLSFASMLGGLITLIGTPPNIVVSGFRHEYTGAPFTMFDFAPVGFVVALAGLAYLSVIGWRLLPHNGIEPNGPGYTNKLAAFVTEVRIPQASPFDGQQVRQIEELCDNEITIMLIVRGVERFYAPRPIARLRQGDVLIVEGDPSVWEPLCDGVRFDPLERRSHDEIAIGSRDVVVAEAVVMPDSTLADRSVRGLRMHDTYGINLLALARSGRPLQSRLKNVHFQVGDVLLLQGESKKLERSAKDLGCLLLAQRGAISAAVRRRVWMPLAIFATAIVGAAFSFVPVPVALVSAAGAMILTGVLSLRDAYDSVEWPIIVLLGALIPIGQAMKSTGTATVIAEHTAAIAGGMPTWGIIAIILVISMWLSDLIHNTPAAVLMAPVAADIASSLQASIDPFLMAVAVGSASAYLTPIGHQSNTLVMAPGGYRFSDFARVGIGLELLIVVVGVPTIMWVWPP
jgi:di/tricarboxylate transporter